MEFWWLMLLRPAQADSYAEYDPAWAVAYARANYSRPYGDGADEIPFTDYGNVELGGNCTVFVSQAIIAGFVHSDDPSVIYDARHEFDVDADYDPMFPRDRTSRRRRGVRHGSLNVRRVRPSQLMAPIGHLSGPVTLSSQRCLC